MDFSPSNLSEHVAHLIDNVRTKLIELDYKKPDFIISSVFDFISSCPLMELKMSKVNKKGIILNICQVTGPFSIFSDCQGAYVGKIHFWLDRTHPDTPPFVTLTEMNVDSSYFRPFLCQETGAVTYQPFFNWNTASDEDSKSIFELYIKIVKILTHIYHGWLQSWSLTSAPQYFSPPQQYDPLQFSNRYITSPISPTFSPPNSLFNLPNAEMLRSASTRSRTAHPHSSVMYSNFSNSAQNSISNFPGVPISAHPKNKYRTQSNSITVTEDNLDVQKTVSDKNTRLNKGFNDERKRQKREKKRKVKEHRIDNNVISYSPPSSSVNLADPLNELRELTLANGHNNDDHTYKDPESLTPDTTTTTTTTSNTTTTTTTTTSNTTTVINAALPTSSDIKQKHDVKQSMRYSDNRNKISSKSQSSSNKSFYTSLSPPMEDYYSQETVDMGLASGKLLEGRLRVNAKNYEQGYIPDPKLGRDVMIHGVRRRNRAQHGDLVVVELLDEYYEPKKNQSVRNEASNISDDDDKNDPQKMGKIVFIKVKYHSRTTAGFLKNYDKNLNVVLFSPKDSRIPRILLDLSVCPRDFTTDKRKYENSLYSVKIIDWNKDSPFPNGQLVSCIGDIGLLNTQMEAILIDNNIFHGNTFSDKSLKCLPSSQNWTIPSEELEKRSDFREECIFTIDPSTARDLDDALHCKLISEGVHEVGVHIADVSYFIPENSDLDNEAKERSTSVYLPNKVIRMLPAVLSEELCSLNPDTDRLAFSVIMTITTQGEVKSTRFTRSIIRSCIKFDYERVQEIISQPTKDWTDEISRDLSRHSPSDIVNSVLMLNTLGVNLRDKRIREGSLVLQKIKLGFTLDPDTKNPIGFHPYIRSDSHFLVEEFMLLANRQVATHLAEKLPSTALLRNHPCPSRDYLDTKLSGVCKLHGVSMDTSSAGSIMKSITSFSKDHDRDDICILSKLCSIPMKLAEYFRFKDDVSSLHYALNFQYYCHFTSPIRRYPDLMVHRQLAEAIGQGSPLANSGIDIDVIADTANFMKTNAKRSGDKAGYIFLAAFLKDSGPIEEIGKVIKVLDQSVDVILTRIGIEVRVYMDMMHEEGLISDFSFTQHNRIPTIQIVWRNSLGKEKSTLVMFSPVKVKIYCKSKDFKLDGIILPPDTINSITNSCIDNVTSEMNRSSQILNEEIFGEAYKKTFDSYVTDDNSISIGTSLNDISSNPADIIASGNTSNESSTSGINIIANFSLSGDSPDYSSSSNKVETLDSNNNQTDYKHISKDNSGIDH